MAAAGRPRVVLFRANAIDIDSRAKKFALTLDRLGYDVVVLSPVEAGADSGELVLGGRVRVVQVPVGTEHRDGLRTEMLRRRARRYRVFSRMDAAAYRERVTAARGDVARAGRLAARVRARPQGSPVGKVLWAAPYAAVRTGKAAAAARVRELGWRQRRQQGLDQRVRRFWTWWGSASRSVTPFATVRGMLPEVLDHSDAYLPVLLDLRPDVLHAHHPFVLPVATEAARRLRAAGRAPRLVYDARENFAGIPDAELGTRRRHHVLMGLEADGIAQAAAVLTVSEPIADALQERYALAERPTVVLNMPVRQSVLPAGPSLRQLSGAPEGVPLIVYSGSISRARGLESLMTAMGQVPDAWLVLVTVPFPHPMTDELLGLAEAAGAGGRVVAVPPVGQDELMALLAGADVGVHPMPGGSPNHDMALPNKLFEYLQAGLTLAVADARLMAAFVREHGLGEVFRSLDADDTARALNAALAARSRQSGAEREALAKRMCWQAQEDVVQSVYQRVAPVPPVDVDRVGEDFPPLSVEAAR